MQMSTRSVSVTAPAKVNLYLAVGATRSDGYHDVTTALAALDMADRLTISHAPSLEFECDTDLGIAPEQNLAYRAARAFSGRIGREPAVRISLEKRIPHGAGLGGGSSDAAGVLVGLAAYWGIGVTVSALEDVAKDLGSDVPFFLRGGVCLYVGRGDRFFSRMPDLEMALVIVRPDTPVNTAEAYSAFDRMQVPPPPGPAQLEQALGAGDVAAVAAALHNNMTTVATGLVPEIGDALAWAQSRDGILGATVAGSGSAVFGICTDLETAREAASDAALRGWWSGVARTVPGGVRVRVNEGGGA